MKRVIVVAALLATALVFTVFAGAREPAARIEWPHVGSEQAHTKYSTADEITAVNVGELEIVWQREPDEMPLDEYGNRNVDDPNKPTKTFEPAPRGGFFCSLLEQGSRFPLFRVTVAKGTDLSTSTQDARKEASGLISTAGRPAKCDGIGAMASPTSGAGRCRARTSFAESWGKAVSPYAEIGARVAQEKPAPANRGEV